MIGLTKDSHRQKKKLQVTFRVPWSGESSKNRRLRVGNNGGLHTPADHREYWEKAALVARLAINKVGFVVVEGEKVHIAILLCRTDDRRVDAANLVDPVCDMLKGVLGVDDRYFAGSWDDCYVDPRYGARIEITLT